jgi:hypothetical protein
MGAKGAIAIGRQDLLPIDALVDEHLEVPPGGQAELFLFSSKTCSFRSMGRTRSLVRSSTSLIQVLLQTRQTLLRVAEKTGASQSLVEP